VLWVVLSGSPHKERRVVESDIIYPDKVGGPEDISNHLITDRGRAGEDGVRPKARYTTLTTKGERREARKDKTNYTFSPADIGFC
jgi:hypothetical protein